MTAPVNVTPTQEQIELAKRLTSELLTKPSYSEIKNLCATAIAQAVAAELERLIQANEELAAALKTMHVELYWCAKQLEAKGHPGHPGDSVDRAMTNCRTLLKAHGYAP